MKAPAKKPAVKAPVKKIPAKPIAKKQARQEIVSPKANQVLSREELIQMQELLLEIKTATAKAIEEKKRLDLQDQDVGDEIDRASQTLEKEILFGLSDNEMIKLSDIEAALRKLENGTYGICEHCKAPIDKKRIKALPSARYCLPCQSGAEKHRAM